MTYHRDLSHGLYVTLVLYRCLLGQEADKLEKALKNEDFRKMLFEYAEEISDPVNRAVRDKLDIS